MAKYRINEKAGLGWPGPRGLVRPGETVVLKDTTVPSRLCMDPLDEAARAALKKAKEDYVADREAKLAELDPPQKLKPKEKAALLHVPELEAPEEEKALDADEDDEGETLAEVGRKVEAGIAGGSLEKTAKGGGKRLADS